MTEKVSIPQKLSNAIEGLRRLGWHVEGMFFVLNTLGIKIEGVNK